MLDGPLGEVGVVGLGNVGGADFSDADPGESVFGGVVGSLVATFIPNLEATGLEGTLGRSFVAGDVGVVGLAAGSGAAFLNPNLGAVLVGVVGLGDGSGADLGIPEVGVVGLGAVLGGAEIGEVGFGAGAGDLAASIASNFGDPLIARTGLGLTGTSGGCSEAGADASLIVACSEEAVAVSVLSVVCSSDLLNKETSGRVNSQLAV